MKIKRDGKEYILTADELAKAAEEFVTNWMRDKLIEDFDVPEDEAEGVAEEAYNLYCEGDEGTEYECVEKAYQKYEQGDD